MVYNPNRAPVAQVQVVGFGDDADPTLLNNGSWKIPISQFSEAIITERTPIIELSSFYGISNLRDIVTTSGASTATASGGTIVLTTASASGASVTIDSAEHGRYVPGYGAEVGIGIQIPAAPTGNQVARWGVFNANDGLYFGHDATNFFVARRRAGVEESKTYRTAFNIDKLDGNGPSGLEYNRARGYIHHINFTWYGYGQIVYSVVDVVNGQQTVVPVHQERISGKTSIRDPNQHIRLQLNNGNTATGFTVNLGGRQYSINGKYLPVVRNTGEFRVSQAVGTTFTPLIAARRRGAQFYGYSCKMRGFTVLCETNDVVLQVRQDATISGGTWALPSNYASGETVLEFNKTASGVTGGNPLWVDLAAAGQKNQNTIAGGVQALEVEIPDDQIIVLCARAVSGASTVDASVLIKEEW